MAVPLIQVRGSHRDIGRQMGSRFQKIIQTAFSSQASFLGVLLPFYNTENGRLIVNTFLSTCTEAYPDYVDEIRGIADGAQVPFMDVFVYHLETELMIYLGEIGTAIGSEGCTDLYLLNTQTACMLHSEDLPPQIVSHLYIVEAEITSQDGTVTEKFTSLCYPGMLPGTAFNINGHGMCSSMNVLFQKELILHGIPRRFLCRALMSISTIEQAVSIVKRTPGLATGFNYNFCWVDEAGEGHITCLELAGGLHGTLSDRRDITGFGHHFNNYIHIEKDLAFTPDPSSFCRESRLAEIIEDSGTPEDLNGLISIINDHKHPQYPFYRSGQPPDYFATGCIVLFDLKRKEASLFSGPVSSALRLYTWQIPTHR